MNETARMRPVGPAASLALTGDHAPTQPWLEVDPMRYVVLGEEYGEVGNALLEQRDRAGELRAELVQVAAVAVAWIEAIDRALETKAETP